MTPAAIHETKDRFEHPALFYSDEHEYLAGTIPFIEAALTADDPVAVAVPGRNLESVRSALGSSAARVLLTDMTVAGANPGRIIPGVLRAFADAHPGRRVRIIGEPIWPGRTELEYPACVQHEALINLAFTGRTVSILCPYDTERLDRQVIADARATHPVVVDHTGHHRCEQYDPGRILTDYNRPLPPPPRSAVERAADHATLDNARWFVTAYGRRLGLSAERLVDLEIAATELLTNSIIHGGGIGTFRVWSDDELLICEVNDAGRIDDPLAGRRPSGEAEDHGRGLLLVNQLADLVRMHTGPDGTTVRIHLRLPEASSRAVG
ncbi:sensor histidine kinase [Glycomyces tenuis]|uniref:sensor histidine kinase n=1 Tax=Glycomyces tenuis TaxID=58116 RepID=UPI0003FF2B1B|nr:sensor histidine kinase [Glycomyces tenuis]